MVLILLPVMAAIAVAVYVAWNIGANDAGNYLGTAVGSRAMSVKRGVLIGAAFSFVGAVFLSGPVIKTVGSGIIPPAQISLAGAFAAVLAAGIFLTAASYLGLSVSTTQTLIGAVIGYGLAIAASVNWLVFGELLTGWIAAPLIAIAFGFSLYYAVRFYFLRKMKGLMARERAEAMFADAQVISASLLALVFGANDISNAIGIFGFVPLGIDFLYVKIFAAAGFAIGVMTFGKKIIATVATKITRVQITAISGFVSQMAAAAVVLVFNQAAGIPLSTTHVMISSIMGAGLAMGLSRLNRKTIAELFASWVLTLPLAAALSFGLVKLLV